MAEVKNGVYIEFNETDGNKGIKSYAGLKLTNDVIEELKEIHEMQLPQDDGYYKFYFEEYKDDVMVCKERFDIGCQGECPYLYQFFNDCTVEEDVEVVSKEVITENVIFNDYGVRVVEQVTKTVTFFIEEDKDAEAEEVLTLLERAGKVQCTKL